MKPSLPFMGALGAGLVAGAAATAVILSSAGGGGEGAGERGPGGRGGYAPVVSMAVAEAAAVERKIDVIGEARALRSVAITSEVTGLVEEANIAPGARVQKGDVLVRINDDEQQVALQRARANYPIARENAERYRNLETDNAASPQEAEQAQNAYIAAQSELRAAEVAVAQRRIVAPFDGIAGLTDIEVGDYIRAGDPVTTLDDTSSIIIDFSVPQEAAGFINIGQTVIAALTSAANIEYEGEITAIDSRVDPASRALPVEATLENPDGRMIPGAVFAVSTTAEGAPAISVPGLAIQWDRSGAYVWKRGRDGAATRAGVVILQRTDDRVLVEGDLAPGDEIVAEGADRVRRGVALPAAGARAGAARAAVASGAE